VEEPPSKDIWLKGPVTKQLWLNRKLLSISASGVLHYAWQRPGTSPAACLVVPRSLVDEVLRYHHDGPSGGHFAFDKTILKLRQAYFWPFMSRDCRMYIEACPECNRNKKPSRSPRAGLGVYHAGCPMERVHVDLLGPFSESRQGNRYVLMVIDQFTKWLECYVLPDQTAERVAQTLVEQFISRFGCPLQTHTDQGANFESDLFRSVCRLLGITKTRTTAHRPCSNGQVERMNRTVLQMMRCYLQDSPTSWDERLPQIAGAIRATVNRSTLHSEPNDVRAGGYHASGSGLRW
jgi:transposase InsO family protein